MRIIAGTKRGMKLLSPKTDVSRPITDRVKESLFSVLYKYGMPEGKNVADLFCGVGSLGAEALSRGAKFVTFVEKDPKIKATLETNIEKAGFSDRSKIIRADAFKIAAGADQQKYDLIFVDPPYSATSQTANGSLLANLLNALNQQLTPEAIAVVRTRKGTGLSERYDRLQVIDQRHWGTMTVTILQQSSK
ncbi:MAG: 16S rRNA (guanine(966)-N(2))-methyltransferase RsmD [Planctomycetota bacterium]